MEIETVVPSPFRPLTSVCVLMLPRDSNNAQLLDRRSCSQPLRFAVRCLLSHNDGLQCISVRTQVLVGPSAPSATLTNEIEDKPQRKAFRETRIFMVDFATTPRIEASLGGQGRGGITRNTPQHISIVAAPLQSRWVRQYVEADMASMNKMVDQKNHAHVFVSVFRWMAACFSCARACYG